jgi:hypothetical protein
MLRVVSTSAEWFDALNGVRASSALSRTFLPVLSGLTADASEDVLGDDEALTSVAFSASTNPGVISSADVSRNAGIFDFIASMLLFLKKARFSRNQSLSETAIDVPQ